MLQGFRAAGERASCAGRRRIRVIRVKFGWGVWVVLAQVCCVVCEIEGLHRDVGRLALPAKGLRWVIRIGQAVVQRSRKLWKRVLRIWGPRSLKARRWRGSVEAVVRIHGRYSRK